MIDWHFSNRPNSLKSFITKIQDFRTTIIYLTSHFHLFIIFKTFQERLYERNCGTGSTTEGYFRIKGPNFFMNLHLIILRIFWLLAIWRYFGKLGSKRNKMFHTRVFVIKHERHDNFPIQNYYIFYICKGQIRKFWFKKNENSFKQNFGQKIR